MNLSLMDPRLIALAVAVVLVIVVAVVLYVRKRKNTTAELRNRFGPEFERAVRQYGFEHKGAAKLADRDGLKGLGSPWTDGSRCSLVLSIIRREPSQKLTNRWCL